MDTNAQAAGIATLKPKRKYTKRKPKLAVVKSVKSVKPTVKKELPKTARAYLRTLGIGAETEGVAIKELIKMHNQLHRQTSIFQPLPIDIGPTGPEPTPIKEEPKSFLRRWFVGYGK